MLLVDSTGKQKRQTMQHVPASEEKDKRRTLFVFAVKQASQVHKLLVGDVLVVDAHSLPLSTQEVGGVDGARTAAVDCVKTLPAHQADPGMFSQLVEPRISCMCVPSIHTFHAFVYHSPCICDLKIRDRPRHECCGFMLHRRHLRVLSA